MVSKIVISVVVAYQKDWFHVADAAERVTGIVSQMKVLRYLCEVVQEFRDFVIGVKLLNSF